MKTKINNYFKYWNQRNLKSLSDLFHIDVTLEDWTLFAKGIDDVLQANVKIFTSHPEIKAKLLNLSQTGNNFYCELLIDTGEDKIKVIDVFELKDGKIVKITAFKI